MNPVSSLRSAPLETPVPTPNRPVAQQTPEEHKAFCLACIDFYVRKYGEIISDAARRNSFHSGVASADKFLKETFSRSPDKGAELDRSIREEIRASVFRQSEQVLMDLTISFSG